MPRSIDPLILQAALIGLEAQHKRIDEQIRQVRTLLTRGGRKAVRPGAASAGKKRVLSAAARKSIAAAQRKRWAEWRKKRKIER